jgi:hypothetical protein
LPVVVLQWLLPQHWLDDVHGPSPVVKQQMFRWLSQPAEQHWLPSVHVDPMSAQPTHLPATQLVLPVHGMPQPPQLLLSSPCVLTHCPEQQVGRDPEQMLAPVDGLPQPPQLLSVFVWTHFAPQHFPSGPIAFVQLASGEDCELRQTDVPPELVKQQLLGRTV